MTKKAFITPKVAAKYPKFAEYWAGAAGTTKEEARKVFNMVAEAHRKAGRHEKAAETEVAREWFTNPEFRETMKEYVWKINEGK